MTYLRKALYGVIALLVILGIIGFMLPAKTLIERSTVIEAPKAEVFDMINDLEQWPSWIGWWGDNDEVDFSYGDLREGQGARVEWESDSQGSGVLSIVDSQPQTSLVYTFYEPNADTAVEGKFELIDEDGDTFVVWTYEADLGINPYFRYFSGILDNMIGSNFEAALRNLKNHLEKESK